MPPIMKTPPDSNVENLASRWSQKPAAAHQDSVKTSGAGTRKLELAPVIGEPIEVESNIVAEELQKALLNSVSHNLRAPLASITGILDSLIEDDLLDPQTRRELLLSARDEAERLNRLVGNLLEMTRLEGGAIHLQVEPCDLRDAVEAAL